MKLKTISRLLLLLLAAVTLVSCNNKIPPEIQEEYEVFIYEENTDGTVSIVGWTGLENELIIPSEINGKTVSLIGENAFRAVNGLTYVKIPDTVKVIDYAFAQCTSLTKVELGNGIEKMNGAFMGCTSLTEIIGGDKAVEMSEAFTGCVSITHAVIPDTVTSCDSAFKGCTALTDIKIGAGVTSINYTFEDCTSLIDITVPSKVTEAIGAFQGCTSLKTVQGGEGLEILDETFKGCISIEELVLGENVKVMKEAFAGCTSLKKIEGLPVSVEAYRPSFTDCSSLTNITVPEITEDNEIKYDLQSDIKGCVALEKLTVLTPFSTKTDFCKTFSGLSYLRELIIPDENFISMMKVESFYVDQPYEGNDSAVKSAYDYTVNTTHVRITDDYGYIDGVSYTHVQGTDIGLFDAEQVEREAEVLGFKDFTKSAYWCGYPKGANRYSSAIAIERKYTFYLRVLGKNDGSLAPEIIVNGVRCSTETMQS